MTLINTITSKGGKESSANLAFQFLDKYNRGAVSDHELATRSELALNKFTRLLKENGLTEQHFCDAIVETSSCSEDKATSLLPTLRKNTEALRKGTLNKEQKDALAGGCALLEISMRNLELGYGLTVQGQTQNLPENLLDQRNACGPQACYALINNLNMLIPTNNFSQQNINLAETLISKCNPTFVGTLPKNITSALEAAVTSSGYHVEALQFDNSTEEIAFLKSNTPALIKLGRSLTGQHYTTINSFISHGDRTYAISFDGLMIPEEKLADLVDQKPYANRVWIIKKDTENSNQHDNLASLKMPSVLGNSTSSQ